MSTPTGDAPPLAAYRVLQVGSGVALDYCGKLFADFGADVVKLEPAGGDPLRRTPPILANGESGLFAWLNTNKRSVTGSDAALAALLPDADVLLDGRPPHEVAASDPGHAALRRAHPGLAITTLSWFGEDGPYRDFAATEATVRALAGLVVLTGPAEGPPILATDHQSGILAGIAAFIATASGLYGRAGGARRFAASVHEASIGVSEYEAGVAWDGAESRHRPGVNRFGRNYPVGIYPTKQGLIGVTIVTPGQWRGLCAMMGVPDIAKEPRFSLNIDRLRQAAELDALFGPIWMTRTAEEWFALALEHKLPLAVVPNMAELLAQAVHRERGAFATVAIGDARFEAPALPQTLTRTPPLPEGRAPLAGADAAAWRPQAFAPAVARPAQAAPEGTLPLAGLRIVDLTMGWAGPTAARHLCDLGAEVIKVEACQYPDWWRGTDLRASFIAEQRYEKIPWFQLMNRNKLDVTLDLTQPEGVALLKRLVAGAHAVIENYSSEVLGKLGLDYPVLSQVRPGLVMASMPAFGCGNAWSACRAYGSTLEQASGLPTITGFPHHPPTMNQTAYGDPVGGFNAAAALIVALLHQQRTGEGQHVDLSQVACMLPLVAAAMIEQSATGAVPPRIGNRHPVFVPQGAFRCAGADSWLAVSVTDDAAWRALCGVIGREDLAGLPAAERRAREEALEAVIAAWTAAREAEDAMLALQAVGVAAGVARLPATLDRDPHLQARGFWRRVDRPFIGPHWQSSAAFREGAAPYPLRRVAPTLGQDNHAILVGRIGLSEAEYADLAARDVIGTVPKPRRPQGDAA
ncbi:MAG: carnitine dehydratase [Rhodospirillales bacterium 69-11]|nr:MAG: carnitine dehydratase [Rhodospirillales bacterium 69-11]